MNLFALVLDPAAIAGWIVAGLAAGWLMGKMMEEPSYGATGDVILGLVGGLAGGVSYALFRAGAGFWASVLVALVAGGLLIAAVRTVVALRSQ